MKIAAIADLHYSKEINPQPERCGARAVELLNKALDMIHNDIKPDILLVAGQLEQQCGIAHQQRNRRCKQFY